MQGGKNLLSVKLNLFLFSLTKVYLECIIPNSIYGSCCNVSLCVCTFRKK